MRFGRPRVLARKALLVKLRPNSIVGKTWTASPRHKRSTRPFLLALHGTPGSYRHACVRTDHRRPSRLAFLDEVSLSHRHTCVRMERQRPARLAAEASSVAHVFRFVCSSYVFVQRAHARNAGDRRSLQRRRNLCRVCLLVGSSAGDRCDAAYTLQRRRHGCLVRFGNPAHRFDVYARHAYGHMRARNAGDRRSLQRRRGVFLVRFGLPANRFDVGVGPSVMHWCRGSAGVLRGLRGGGIGGAPSASQS